MYYYKPSKTIQKYNYQVKLPLLNRKFLMKINVCLLHSFERYYLRIRCVHYTLRMRYFDWKIDIRYYPVLGVVNFVAT